MGADQIYIDVQGERLPALGFGTWQLTGETAREATRHAIELGYRQIDTARAYRNEAEVGQAIKDSGVDRSELFVTTKLWRDDLPGEKVGPAVEESLERLGLDAIDLLLIHWPAEDVPLTETLDAMKQAQDAGKVRHLGVSNFRAPVLEQAMAHTRIFADQIPYQPGRTQNSVSTIAREQDVVLTAYSPLRGDAVTSETMVRIAEAHGKTPQQVALRWLLQQPNVSPIPRSSKAEHRAANFDVFDFELSEDEMSQIFGLAGKD